MSVEDIDGVIEGLAGIVGKAREDADRVGYFAALYRQVTVRVRQAIQAGRFDDGQRMSRFDALFGIRYFDALGSWLQDRSGPACWRVAFEMTRNADTIIVQHLLLGVNAHINLDLAVATAQTAPGESIQDLHRDFLLINDILVGVLADVQHAVDEISPYMWLLDKFGGRDEGRRQMVIATPDRIIPECRVMGKVNERGTTVAVGGARDDLPGVGTRLLGSVDREATRAASLGDFPGDQQQRRPGSVPGGGGAAT
jgi:hypothetical protein